MALDFPNAPSTGQTYVSGTVTWTWDGTKWVVGTTPAVTYAPLLSPVFLGDPQAPTPITSDSDNSIATTAFVNALIPASSSTTPLMDGTAAIGYATTWAKADHIHPSDTSRASVAYVDAKTWGYAALPAAVQQLPLPFFVAGKPAAGGKYHIVMPWAITVPANLTGSRIFTSTTATGSSVFIVNKVSGGSTTALGTVTVTAGSNIGATLAGAGGSLATGDALQLVAPGTQDGTLADIAITILGAKT